MDPTWSSYQVPPRSISGRGDFLAPRNCSDQLWIMSEFQLNHTAIIHIWNIETSTFFSFQPRLSNLNKHKRYSSLTFHIYVVFRSHLCGTQVHLCGTSMWYSHLCGTHALNPLTIATTIHILLTSISLTRDLISAFSPDHVITGHINN